MARQRQGPLEVTLKPCLVFEPCDKGWIPLPFPHRHSADARLPLHRGVCAIASRDDSFAQGTQVFDLIRRGPEGPWVYRIVSPGRFVMKRGVGFPPPSSLQTKGDRYAHNLNFELSASPPPALPKVRAGPGEGIGYHQLLERRPLILNKFFGRPPGIRPDRADQGRVQFTARR